MYTEEPTIWWGTSNQSEWVSLDKLLTDCLVSEVAEPEPETSDTKQSVSNLSKDTHSDWLDVPHQIVGSSVYTTGYATLRILGLL